MPGPPRIPTKLKVIRGTDKKTRLLANELEFKPLIKKPRPPKLLNKRAKKEWRIVCSNLFALNMLYQVDLPQLQAYCFMVGILEEAEEELATGKLIVTQTNNDGHEYKAKNKYFGIYNEALDKMNKLAREFGFSPSARTRISMINPGQNELDKRLLDTA